MLDITTCYSGIDWSYGSIRAVLRDFFLCTIDIGEIIKGYTDSDRKGRGILVLALVTFIALLIISLTAFNYFLFAPKIIHYVSTVKQVRFTSMITLTCTSGIWRKRSPRYLNSLFPPYAPSRKSF